MDSRDHREKPVVLVMDDDASHRAYAKAFFTSEGYPVSLASTMKVAMNSIHAKGRAQDMIVAFIDLHMLDNLAHEVFRYIRRTASHRVIAYAWTGDTSDDAHLAAIRAGAFRVFYKDVHSEDILLDYMQADIELIRAHGEDDLTGLYNIRSFRRAVLEEMKEMRDHGHPVVASLIFIDVDDFKSFNEDHGHLVGDEALKEVAKGIKRLVRPTDHLCRKGGDEFLVWMPGLTCKDALERAHVIQQNVAAQWVEGKDGTKVPLGISVGVAEITASHIGEDLMGDLKILIDQSDAEKKEDKKTKGERRQASG